MQDKFSINLRRLSLTAVFLSVALTLRLLFSFYIPLFGENGMRVGISGIFSTMPSILFGPVWGAIATGLNDILGFIMRPTGTYLPQMTLILASGAFLRGLAWLLLRNRDAVKIRRIVLVFSVAVLLFGLVNLIFFHIEGVNRSFFDGFVRGEDILDTSGMFFMSRFILTRALGVTDHVGTLNTMVTTFTLAPIGVSVLGFTLCIVDFLMSKSLKKDYKEYTSVMPLLIAMLIGAWWQSTFNSIVLRQHVFTSWQHMPFIVVWLPRILQTTITTTVYSYFVALLYQICKRQNFLKPYLR